MIKTALYFLVFIALASCAKKGPPGADGYAGPADSGSIAGHVKLYDMYGSEVLNDLYRPALTLSTPLNGALATLKPDSSGAFLFSPLAAGKYSITASDSAYASTTRSGIQLVMGALYADVNLSAIPDSFVSTFTAYHNSGSVNDSLVFTFLPDTRLRYCIVFANNIPTVSNATAYYKWSQVLSISPTAPLVTYTVPAADLVNSGIASGVPVYYVAYSYVVGDASVYEDLASGKKVYNAVSGPVFDSTLAP